MTCTCGCPLTDPTAAGLEDTSKHLRKVSMLFQARLAVATIAADMIEKKTNVHPVIHFVSQEYNVDVWLLLSRARTPHVAFARFVIGWLLRETTSLSLSRVGKILRRDHASILHGCKVVNKRMEREPLFARRMLKYKNLIGGNLAESRSVSLVPSLENETEHKPQDNPLNEVH